MIKENTTIKILFVGKNVLYPSFGRTDIEKKIIYIRQDLNKHIIPFIIAHEISHAIEGKIFNSKIMMEVTANLSAAVVHPVGFLITLYKSIFSIDRLKMYKNLFFKK